MTGPKKQPQLIDIKEKIHFFREDRISINSSVETDAKIYQGAEIVVEAKVINVSNFGLRLKVKDLSSIGLYFGQNLERVAVKINRTEILDAPCIVNNISLEDSMIGLIPRNHAINLERVNAILLVASNDRFESAKLLSEQYAKVNPYFKGLVADLNTLFQDIKIKLLSEEKIVKAEFYESAQIKEIEKQIIFLARDIYTPQIHNIFNEFNRYVKTLNLEEVSLHKQYFRANFHPLLMGTPFIYQAFAKPLGYPGDFRLMLMLYENEQLGDTLFDKFFQEFAVNEPASVANKNRIALLKNEIVADYYLQKQTPDEIYRIISIASGPAREIEMFLREINLDHGKRIEIICVDQEPLALQYAQKRLRPLADKKNVVLKFVEADVVLDLIRHRGISRLITGTDVIICAGLFDYLSDRVSAKLVNEFYGALKPNGKMLIGNVSTENPDTFTMDFFMDWHLVLRNEEQLLSLVPDFALNAAHVIHEPLKLNLFLKVKK